MFKAPKVKFGIIHSFQASRALWHSHGLQAHGLFVILRNWLADGKEVHFKNIVHV